MEQSGNISSGESRIFPRWGRQLSGGWGVGRQHTILPNSPPKLYEIERIFTPGGREGPSRLP